MLQAHVPRLQPSFNLGARRGVNLSQGLPFRGRPRVERYLQARRPMYLVITPLVDALYHLVITHISRHDVIFLLTITAAVSDGGKAGGSVQRVDLVSLRGAEVVQLVDEEGHVFTGESEQEQKLRGDVRRVPSHGSLASLQTPSIPSHPPRALRAPAGTPSHTPAPPPSHTHTQQSHHPPATHPHPHPLPARPHHLHPTPTPTPCRRATWSYISTRRSTTTTRSP